MLKLRQNLKATLSKITSEEGHSLLSTALAIVGLGLLLTVGFTVVGIYDKQTKLIQSDDNIKIVREAITEYSEIHGRIPCPASMTADVNTAEFGVSVGGAAGCETGAFSGVERVTGEKGSAVLIGSIPTRTLNLGDDAALDGYEGKFFFAVTGSFTSPSANMSPSDGDISILDEHGNSVTSSNSGVVYAIVASGANQNGAFSQNGQQIEPCNTASFAGVNCDFDDATFNVSMNKSFGMGDDSFTDSFFYMASNDVYQWKVGYGECTCPTKTRPAVVECYKIPGGFGGTDDGGGNDGGAAPLPVLVNDSFCPSPRPTPEAKDCSAEPQVNDCFGWYTPPWGSCPCGTSINRTSTCNEKSGNSGSLIIANVTDALQCDREGDVEPQPNPETLICGDCISSDDSSDNGSDNGGDNGGDSGGDSGGNSGGDSGGDSGGGDAGNSDPVVLDLNGDGIIEFRAINEGTMFDVDNDGVADHTSWVGSGDGLLAEDRNGNGIIDAQNELFGTPDLQAFDHLALHDSNKNGVIDPDDKNYGDIIVWQDENSDGISQASEMKSLDEWDIVSIDLTHEEVDEIEGTQQVTGRGAFTRVLDTGEEIISSAVEFLFNMFKPDDENS
jgi:hypothetical protein